MTHGRNAYSLKSSKQWLWQTGFTREQVLAKLDGGQISSDWLVCPVGHSHRAVSVDRFVSDPDIFGTADQARTGVPRKADDHDNADPHLSTDLVPVIVIATVFNLMTPAMLSASTYVIPVIVLGIFGAEVGLVAIWGVFSSAHFKLRFAICASIGFLFFGAVAFGVLGSMGLEPGLALFFLSGLALCPLVLCSAQLPFWVVRVWLGFEVGRPDQPPKGSYLRSPRIQDLFIATAGVGVMLALIKMTLSLLPGDAPLDELFQSVIFLSIVAASISLLVMTPLVFATLAPRRTLTCLIANLGVVCVFAVVLVNVVVRAMPPTPGLMDACALGCGTFVTALVVGLVATRIRGYRLFRRRGANHQSTSGLRQDAAKQQGTS